MIWLLPNVVNKKIQGIINCQGGIISSLIFFYRCVGVCVCGHVSVEWTFFFENGTRHFGYINVLVQLGCLVWH
jgi:hypothetical protein